jgi:ABC-2 type transport system ATP-binding protein
VLFLDEPTTGLDPTSRTALWEEVRRLNAEGTTVFLTTQYLEEADELAGRVAIIDGGRIVREGQPEALKATIGADTLVVTVGADHEIRAAEVLERFGSSRAAKTGSVAIGLEGGPSALSGALRALEDAGIAVEHVELDAASLDDVFAEATGRRLEGAAGGEAPEAVG